jgi:hypothetical protein
VKYEDFWPGERRNTEGDYPRQRSQDTVSRHMAERAEQVRDEEITRLRAELAEAREAVVVLAEGIKAVREQRTHEYKYGLVPGGPVSLRLETACRNIFNNPIADAAVKKAGGGA